ncbi:MAG: VCBS repeat-containing protein [Betaproteobacteria bacterium]
MEKSLLARTVTMVLLTGATIGWLGAANADDNTCDAWCVSDGGTSSWRQINSSVYGLELLALGDFDGDGKVDVFHADGEKWYVSYGGTGNWERIADSQFKLDELAIADFNGDGKADVFRANGHNWIVSYSGTGSWQPINTSKTPLSELAFADFNGDGKADVFRADGHKWYVSYGGTASWRPINTSTTRLNELAFADFDGDGKADVFRADGHKWYVSYGGTASWQPINTSQARISELGFADLDGDGKADVFRSDGRKWYVSYGGTGNWQPINISGSRRDQLAFADFDGDRKADVFRAHPSGLLMASHIALQGRVPQLITYNIGGQVRKIPVNTDHVTISGHDFTVSRATVSKNATGLIVTGQISHQLANRPDDEISYTIIKENGGVKNIERHIDRGGLAPIVGPIISIGATYFTEIPIPDELVVKVGRDIGRAIDGSWESTCDAAIAYIALYAK